MQKRYDLVVLGGGPAGYAAAIRAGQLKKRVACVEKERAGGTCLNWGCIPSKALLQSAQLYQKCAHAEDFGLQLGGARPSFDFAQIMGRSRGVSDRMGKGIEFLFKKNHVDYLVGEGQLTDAHTLRLVEGAHKGSVLQADHILVATGCKPRALPDCPFDGRRVLSSRDALALTQRPESLIILGAGAIGAEFAYFFNALGTRVHLVERLGQLLPLEDAEVAQTLQRAFHKQGIQVHTQSSLEGVVLRENGVAAKVVSASGGGQPQQVEADALLVAIGVVPQLEGVFGAGMSPKLDARGYLAVDSRYQTSIPGVYAAGDIIGPPWLAHVATHRAVAAVDGLWGGATPRPMGAYPGCTYCSPQVASVGLTEQAAQQAGVAYKVGKFPFAAVGKAVAMGETEGFVKVLVDPEYGQILGAHLIGPDATEMVAEFVLAMHLEATVDDLHHVIHAHPTLSEAIGEAAAAVHGRAIHI